MITVLLSGVVQAGEDVRTIIKGAKAWPSKEAFTRSSNFEAARARREDVETQPGLLAMKPEGSTR